MLWDLRCCLRTPLPRPADRHAHTVSRTRSATCSSCRLSSNRASPGDTTDLLPKLTSSRREPGCALADGVSPVSSLWLLGGSKANPGLHTTHPRWCLPLQHIHPMTKSRSVSIDHGLWPTWSPALRCAPQSSPLRGRALGSGGYGGFARGPLCVAFPTRPQRVREAGFW